MKHTAHQLNEVNELVGRLKKLKQDGEYDDKKILMEYSCTVQNIAFQKMALDSFDLPPCKTSNNKA